MKRFLTLAAMLAAACLSAAPEKSVSFGDVKVQVKVQSAPMVEFRSKTSAPGTAVSQGNRDWVVIAVTFVPGVGSKGHVKSMRGGWADDVVLDVAVELPMDIQGGQKKSTGLFTGSSRFWPIPLDGKPHTALMFIPGRLLDRYLPLRGGAEGKYTEKYFRVQAVFRSADGAELGSGYFNLEGTPKEQALYFASLANETVVKDAVFPRNKTPWALLYPEHYDLLKE